MIGKGTNSREVVKTAGFAVEYRYFLLASISILWIPEIGSENANMSETTA